MIVSCVRLALGDILSPPLRAVLWKCLGLTILALIGLWFGIEAGFSAGLWPSMVGYLPARPTWAVGVDGLASFLAGLLLALVLAYLIGPISTMIAGFFLDEVAEAVETTHHPDRPSGRPMPFWSGILSSVQFMGIAILGNLAALILLFVPGVNIAAFFVVNGYLLGREYFEFAAFRFRSQDEARGLRRRHRGTVFLAGLFVAVFLAVPLVNLLTPLFAAALMVHLHQALSSREEKEAKVER